MGFCTEMIWITPWYECFLLFSHFLLIVHVFLRDFQEIDINKIILSSQFSCLNTNMKLAFQKKNKKEKKPVQIETYRVLVNLPL